MASKLFLTQAESKRGGTVGTQLQPEPRARGAQTSTPRQPRTNVELWPLIQDVSRNVSQVYTTFSPKNFHFVAEETGLPW